MSYQPKSRMLFCDWHMPNFLPEVRIDYDRYFEAIARTGAQTLIFMTKTAHGGCFFPTEVGVVNPAMTGDIIGEVSTRAKALGLEFIAYYNVVLSWDLAKLHPEWAQLGRDGQPLRMFLYPCSCMSWDPFRDYVAAHMGEVTRRYPIDGWFLDLQYFSPEGCFCAACRERFAAMFGYPLEPSGFGVREWRDLLTYQVRRREAFIAHLREHCNAIRPGLSWSWNGCGSPFSISASLHEGADYLSTEAHPPEYLHAEHATRYCEGLGLPFTLFMPESQGSWGDWTVTTPATIQGLSAVALAHGGSLNINHVPYPCGERAGQVPEIVWDTIAKTFSFVAEREAHCMGKRPVPVVAVLHSAENARLLQAMSRAGRGGHWGGATYGNEHALAQLLGETHTPWELRPAELPLAELRRYELLVLPYLPHVDEALAERLRAYVRDGGSLLANDHTALFDADGERLANFALADLFGVDYLADSPYSVSYLDRLDPVLAAPDLPLLLKDTASGRMNPANHSLYTRLREGARPLAMLMDPVIESDFEGGRYVYHDHAPPGRCTDHPGIVLHRYGAGQVVYFPIPFLASYRAKSCPFLKGVFRALLNEVLGVPARVRITAPVSVKTALMEDDAGWLLHLIHLQRETDSMYLDRFHRADPITVRVCPGWPVASLTDCLSGEVFAPHVIDGWTEFTVPGVIDHRIVRVGRG